MIKEIKKCRVCKSSNLKKVLSLGDQALTSLPLDHPNKNVLKAPLELVECMGECGLIQLRHSVNRSLIYGDKYGYKSGINQTMKDHLKWIAGMISSYIKIKEKDIIIDIGSNDGTLLSYFPNYTERIGVDPSGKKYYRNYKKIGRLYKEYFSKYLVKTKARVITSIAMFYDLEDPIKFAKDIYDSLTDDGIWVFEQSDINEMLYKNSYDTICHEHLEYYGLSQIYYILNKSGFYVDWQTYTKTNGGSLLIVAKKGKYGWERYSSYLDQKTDLKLFCRNIDKKTSELNNLLMNLESKNKTIIGYGASTKGNVILQHCGLNRFLTAIADRNPEKWGKYTPGTNIPIISEEEARKANPDYMLVLPWHFKDEFIKRERKYLDGGGRFIFPLPNVEIYPK